MCNQSVGLIASVIEKAGIPTVGLSLLREVAEQIKPPRMLFVPFPFGYPLGEPNNPALQHDIILSALRLFERPDARPILSDFQVSQGVPSSH
jgi:hypothetical protein